MTDELAWTVEDFRASMKHTLLAVVLMCVVGCGSFQSPTIALDVGRDAAYFNGVCAYQDATAKNFPQFRSPCVRGGVNDVEQSFRTEFLANSACSGVHLANLPDLKPYPAKTSVLSFNSQMADDGSVSGKDSGWRLIGSSGSPSGTVGDMHDTVTNICRIVKGEGGRIQ
jgi:hypothetical protein